ncbi:unnamed protein product [Brassica rapa subsp. narinosa]
MMLLVHTRRKLDSFNGGGFSKIGSFGDLGFAVCGSLGRLVVDLFIILSQAGFCVGYLIFIGTTLANLFDPDSPTSLRHHITTLGFPFQLGLNSIKTLTHLAPLSIFADVVDLAAMAVVIVEDSMIILKQRPDFGGFSLFFYGMGVAVYSFEGVGMVLPLESEMKDKDKFGKVLALGMGFISFIYIAFGFLRYLAFSEDTMDIITANLGAGLISTIAQLGLCINLFFTFPLMMNPVFEIVERRFSGGMYSAWLRWLLVLAVTLVALFVANFTDFLLHLRVCVTCFVSFAGVQGRDGESGHSDSGTGRGSCCVGNLEFPE